MKKLKLALTSIIAVGVLGAAGVAYAASALSPAEVVSNLTGKSIEELREERAEGKTYGTIAKEEGKLDQFKAQMLENKKVILDQKVAAGEISKEDADKIYAAILKAQENCDGTGEAQLGKDYGIGFGQGNGMKNGEGCRGGQGMRRGQGGGRNGQGNGQCGNGCTY